MPLLSATNTRPPDAKRNVVGSARPLQATDSVKPAGRSVDAAATVVSWSAAALSNGAAAEAEAAGRKSTAAAHASRARRRSGSGMSGTLAQARVVGPRPWFRLENMRYRQLGSSGLRVSALTLGTMTFGGRDQFASVGSTDVAGATRQIDLCLDRGVNFIDTANVYSAGLSEDILGEAIKGRRDRV